jgi:hypothetical protein
MSELRTIHIEYDGFNLAEVHVDTPQDLGMSQKF